MKFDIAWKCHSCGELRLDRNISVISYPYKDFPNATINKRYCNDKLDCYKKAVEKSKTGKV